MRSYKLDLKALGVDAVETGFPASSPSEFQAARLISEHLTTARLVTFNRAVRADIDAAVRACVTGAFWAAGQNCLHVQRLLVHRSIYPAFVRRLVDATSRLVVGRKLSARTDMGPLVN